MRAAFLRARFTLPVCVLASFLGTCGCVGGADLAIEAPPESLRSIYVVRRGWHTGVAIPTTDWPNRHWRVLGDFVDADYLEFGWGDERFFQGEANTVWQGSRAAFWPSSSVVHVIGLREPLLDNAHALDIVEVRVSNDRLRTLAAAIEQEFAGDQPSPTGVSLREAPDPNRFYKGRRDFYFPRMCNWWTASRLQEAGCSIAPATVLLASRVMREARECVRWRPGAPAT